MSRTRRACSAAFNSKVILEALKETLECFGSLGRQFVPRHRTYPSDANVKHNLGYLKSNPTLKYVGYSRKIGPHHKIS
jgi:hypothetical protein